MVNQIVASPSDAASEDEFRAKAWAKRVAEAKKKKELKEMSDNKKNEEALQQKGEEMKTNVGSEEANKEGEGEDDRGIVIGDSDMNEEAVLECSTDEDETEWKQFSDLLHLSLEAATVDEDVQESPIKVKVEVRLEVKEKKKVEEGEEGQG